MKSPSLETMSIDELWALHKQLADLLADKLTREKRVLEERLAQLGADGKDEGNGSKAVRRPYPKVAAKYQNPANPTETWSGRGKLPRWLAALLKSGNRVDDFRIKAQSSRKANRKK
jgi:DNA-binding protein H-NS